MPLTSLPAGNAGPDAVIVVESVQGRVEFVRHVAVDGIVAGQTIERDDRNAPGDGIPYSGGFRIGHHAH